MVGFLLVKIILGDKNLPNASNRVFYRSLYWHIPLSQALFDLIAHSATFAKLTVMLTRCKYRQFGPTTLVVRLNSCSRLINVMTETCLRQALFPPTWSRSGLGQA